MKNFTYVDNSNVYIEGCRVAAVRRKLPGAGTIIDAMNNRVVDNSWKLDYGRLHEFAWGMSLWLLKVQRRLMDYSTRCVSPLTS